MQATGSDAGQAEGTNIMKDEKKDFEMKNDAGTDMTEEMPRPEEGAATDGTAKVRVRPKSKAARPSSTTLTQVTRPCPTTSASSR